MVIHEGQTHRQTDRQTDAETDRISKHENGVFKEDLDVYQSTSFENM